MASGLQKNITLLVQETVNRRNFVIIVFSVISVLTVLVGSNWPKSYTSYTTIFVEEENILGPLMEGAAVQTEVVDRAAIAREIIFGHKIMYQLLQREGLVEQFPDPVVQDQLMNSIKGQLNISNARRNLIRIEFKDSDPDRSYRITAQLAKLFIEGSLIAKAQQSTEAFEFIDNQAKNYKEKLKHAEFELKIFRSANVDARPGMPGEIGRRSGELQRMKEQIVQELKELRIRKASLIRQLSGEAQASSAFSRSEQYKTRIAGLQAQLDDLRLSYHETYPDIIQIKSQIENLRVAVKKSELDPQSGSESGNVVIDERILSNPVYQQLQRDLYNANTTIETLEARLEQTILSISKQLDRARNVEEYEAALQELTRDYEVNHDSYIDLMRRREQARVSMNLDIEQKGLSLRVDEPAYFPHSPSGVRFLHFLLAGPLLGLVLPIGFIFVLRQLDPRVRLDSLIIDNLGIPVLGKTPHLSNVSQVRRETVGLVGISVIFLASIAFIIAIAVLRTQGKV